MFKYETASIAIGRFRDLSISLLLCPPFFVLCSSFSILCPLFYALYTFYRVQTYTHTHMNTCIRACERTVYIPATQMSTGIEWDLSRSETRACGVADLSAGTILLRPHALTMHLSAPTRCYIGRCRVSYLFGLRPRQHVCS